MQIHPMTYAVTILGAMIATMMLTTWLFHNIYDWEQITINHARLAELEPKAQMYEAMHSMNVGVYCELAVHYGWTPLEDFESAILIIEEGVHDQD